MAGFLAAFSVQASPSAAQESQALQGGITQTINLPSLDAALAPGNLFNKNAAEDLIGKSKESNNWHMVPSWYRGQRATEQMTVNYSKDEKTGVEDKKPHRENRRSVMQVDTYKDRTGQLWEYDAQGFWIEGESDEYFHYNWVISRAPTLTNDTECDHMTRGVGFHVDKKTYKIVSCDRSLAQISATSVSPTVIRSKAFQKIFDWQGYPIRTVETVCNYKKTAEGPGDRNGMTHDGKPIYRLFVQFLKANNMTDRIPEPPV